MKKFKYISVNKLKNHPSNPRVIKNSQFKILCESIRENPEFFETRPILYNKEGIIFAGNQRFRAAKEIGMKEVPAVLMDVSEAKQKELMIRDNRIQGEWDFDVLSNEWEFEDLRTWGFDEKELINEHFEIEEKELQPYNKSHILISYNPGDHLKISSIIDKLKKIEGIEIEQSTN